MKADLDQGFARISITLLYALPLFRLSGAEEAVFKLIMASAWGHATRSPGYTCDLTVREIVDYLDGVFGQAVIYLSVQKLRRRTLLTQDTATLTINPHCIKTLSLELQDRLEVMMQVHDERKRYSRPALRAIKHDSNHLEKNSNHLESHNKDVRAGRERERLKSSSNIAMNDLENTVPKADDDDFKAQSQRLRQELVRLAAQRARRPESEFAAQIDAVIGRTPEELALGMARLIDRMRANAIGTVANLRGLLASASDPRSTSWGNATPQSVLAATPAQAPPPVIDQDAMFAESLRLEREARARRT